MLQNISELPNETELQKGFLVDCWMRGVVAYDSGVEAELRVSHARRRSFRPRHYYIFAPNGKTFVQHLKPGWLRLKHTSKVFGLSAYNDAEAIAKANAVFAKKFVRFMKIEFCRDTQEDIERQIIRFATEHIQKQYDPNWIKKVTPSVLQCLKEEANDTGDSSTLWKLRFRYEFMDLQAIVRDTGVQLTLLTCEQAT